MHTFTLSSLALLSAATSAQAAPVFEVPSLSNDALQEQRGGRPGATNRFALSESYVLTQFRITADLRVITFDNWFFDNGPDLFTPGVNAMILAPR